MNEEDRIHRYLSARAESINLPPLELGSIIERSGRRQRRRRAGVGIAAAVLVVGASVALVTNGGDNPDKVDVAAAGAAQLVASPLDWTVVDQDPGLGLGWSQTLTATADGSLYALSTAPGIQPPLEPQDECCFQEPARLYRSADGAGWEELGLPADLWASGLTADGDTLYAVGTAPAGGGRKLVVRSTDDGGANWSEIDLPLDLSDLYSGDPKSISVDAPKIAHGPAGVVVALTVSVWLDYSTLLLANGFDPASYSAMPTEDGVDVARMPECMGKPTGGADASELPVPPDCGRFSEGESEIESHLTWDQLGVTSEQLSLMKGRLHVFHSADGTTFTSVRLPEGISGIGASVVADDAGFYVTTSAGGPIPSPSANVLRSADGVTWTSETLPLSWVTQAGVVDGRAVIAGGDESSGEPAVAVSDGAGGWTFVDLAETLGIDIGPEGNMSFDVGFGPLGVAAFMSIGPIEDQGSWKRYVVHSSDGSTWSAVDLNELLGGREFREWPSGVTVTADAITVRFADSTGEDPMNPPTEVPGQVLVVGTPR